MAPVIPIGNEGAPGQPDDERSREARILARAFAPIDRVAFGAATGVVFAAGLFLASAWLIVRGGAIVGPNLGLLGQFLPGFRVTWPGAFIGLAYGAVLGFAVGWFLAHLKNASNRRFIARAKAAAGRADKGKLLDYV
jgi:hypothetical protein